MAQQVTNALYGATMSQHPTSSNVQQVSVGQSVPFNPAQGMTLQQLANIANQQYANQYAQQQSIQNAAIKTQNMNLNQLYQQSIPMPQKDWMWDGKAYSLTEFADLAFGDTPERTAFLLKYTKGEMK